MNSDNPVYQPPSPPETTETGRSNRGQPDRITNAITQKYSHAGLTDVVTLWAGASQIISPPVAAASGTTILTDIGALTLTGIAPMVATLTDIGALVLTGLAPTVQIAVVVAPGVGSLVLDGLSPTVQGSAPVVVISGPKVRRALVVRRAPPRRAPILLEQRHPRYLQLAEDVICEPGPGVLKLYGAYADVLISDTASEQAMVAALEDEMDPDLALALAAETWIS